MDGLKSWAKQELQRRGVQDLTRAMTVAESLVEFKKVDKLDSSKSKGKGGGDRDWDKAKHKERDKQPKEGSRKPSYRQWKSSKEGDKKEREPQACFLCDEPYRMQDCLK